MKEKSIKELETQEMVEIIRNDDKSSFSVFLSIELRERFDSRPVEEAHLNFDQWRKLLILREDHKSEIQKTKDFNAQCERWLKQQKNEKKSLHEIENVQIPAWMKTSTTRYLLKLRWSWNDEINLKALYAELATREHVPNKAEGKKLRREAAKRKK